MNRFFGTKKPQAPKATLGDALAATDARVDSMDSKIKKLDSELYKYKEQMSKMKDGPAKDAIKKRALAILKQKKMYEGQRDQMAQQSFNINQADFAIESVKNTMTTVEAMKDASKVLKQQFKKIDVNKVEEIQYNMEDMLEEANELNEVMARSYGLPDDVDEDMLDAELEALGEEALLEDTGDTSYLDELNSTNAASEPLQATPAEATSAQTEAPVASNPSGSAVPTAPLIN